VITQVDVFAARFNRVELVEVRFDLDPVEAVLRVARRPATDEAPS
jgi:hypothetical protein